MEDTQDDVVATKRRGRPANPNAVKKEKTGRPRGRPAKNSNGSPIKAAANGDTGSEPDDDVVDDKKRGRPKKEAKATKVAPAAATGRGRGRPKAQNGATKANGTPEKIALKKKKEEDDDVASDVSKDEDDEEEEAPQNVSKGRAKKDVKKRSANESTDESITTKKRGRKAEPQKTSSGKARGRAKAKNADESADEDIEEPEINGASENEDDASAIDLDKSDKDEDGDDKEDDDE